MLDQLGRHGGLDLTVQATGDLQIDAHHTVEDTGILLGSVLKRGAGRQGRCPAVRVPAGAARRGRGRIGPGPVGPAVPALRHRSAGREDPGRPAVRPAADGGVLAGRGHLGGHHAAPDHGAGPQHPPHHRGVDEGRGTRRSATRCASKAPACRRPRASCDAAAASPRPSIAVLDYGIGNLRSAQKALEHVGADAHLTADAAEIAAADAVVLPGVGAFGRCREALARTGLDEQRPDRRGVRAGRSSASASACSCSTTAPRSRRVSTDWASCPASYGACPTGVKHPQMQWNQVDLVGSPALFAGLGERPWMYFVHSFAAEATDDVVATCDYGAPVTAAVQRDNVHAMQFHPEKSGTAGLAVLSQLRATGRPADRRSAVVIDLYPAIDLLGGRCVRLYQGDYDRETVYGDDPVAQAQAVRGRGRVVDPRGRPGRGPFRRTGQPGRRRGDRRRRVGAGAERRRGARRGRCRGPVRCRGRPGRGRAPLRSRTREFVRRLAARRPVAVGLDARGRDVAVRGWLEGSGQDLLDLAAAFADAGVAALVVTEISRDGTLEGPDVAGPVRRARRDVDPGDRLGRGRHPGGPRRPSPRWSRRGAPCQV